MPKQFLTLTDDDRSMIQLTMDRIRSIVEVEDIYIVTNKEYRGLVSRQLPEIPPENILCEPVGRNTGPCIGLGAMHIAHKLGDAMMFVLPSDHLVKYDSIFIQTMEDACEVAESGSYLVTIGITPDHPETGYGYIKFDPDRRLKRAFAVEQFVEKPSLETAKAYLASREYLWNSGMFIWKASTILESIRECLPETYAGLERVEAAIGTGDYDRVIDEEYRKMESASIDYGVMEKARSIYCLAGTFGWDDLGSWPAIGRVRKTNDFGNVVTGNVITVDTKASIIQGGDKLIAAVGLKDIIIVDTPEALLVCDKDSASDIKKVLDILKTFNKNEYL